MINTQYINLNMIPSGVIPVLYCSQYDIGRPLGMVVYNGGEAVDLDTYTCTIEATRTDGTTITAAVTTDDNIGVFVTTATMTNQADMYPAKLVLFDSNSRRVASLAFLMNVTAAAMDENSEAIEEDKSLYQQYTEAVQGAIAEANADIQAEENARIAADAILTETVKHLSVVVTPEMYGAKGDGETDDTDAMKEAILSGHKVVCKSGATYIINGLDIDEEFYELDGNKCIFKASKSCDYILHLSGHVGTVLTGYVHDIIFDGDHLATDLIFNEYSYRRTFYNITLNNPAEGGSGFHQGSIGGGTRLYSINGKDVNYTNNSYFLKIEGADININMADYQFYKTGLYCRSSCQINQFHGYILSETDYTVYQNSKFMHLDGGRVSATNVYPDTQQFWFYIERVGSYEINGGYGYHNILVTNDMVANSELQNSYVVYVVSPNSGFNARRFHLTNFIIDTPAALENIIFSNYPLSFDVNSTCVTADSNCDLFSWQGNKDINRIVLFGPTFNNIVSSNNLKLEQNENTSYITGSITISENADTTSNNTFYIGTTNTLYSIDYHDECLIPVYVGTSKYNATPSDVKIFYDPSGNRLVLYKLLATDLAGKTLYLGSPIPIVTLK